MTVRAVEKQLELERIANDETLVRSEEMRELMANGIVFLTSEKVHIRRKVVNPE